MRRYGRGTEEVNFGSGGKDAEKKIMGVAIAKRFFRNSQSKSSGSPSRGFNKKKTSRTNRGLTLKEILF